MINTKKIEKRIQAVFDELDKQGIIGKQRYLCCMSCGCSAIQEYSNVYDGYVFYHRQDYDTAKKCGMFYLAYGSMGKTKKTCVDIGNLIVLEFKKQGINVEWSGNEEDRISIDFKDELKELINDKVKGGKYES